MDTDNNKKIILLLMIFTVIFMIIGGSLAYFTWISDGEQKTNIVFTVERYFSCAVDGGGSITNNDALIAPTIVNSSNISNYIKRVVKVTPTIDEDDKTIYMDLWLDINKLDNGLSNSVNFKYAFTTSSVSNTVGVVASGDFNGKRVGDKINLLSGKNYSVSTTDTYYLWIWLDSAETSSSTMDQLFNLSLNGLCDESPSASRPYVDNGMIPVVISNNGIVSTIDEENNNWYNYNNKEWANVVLVSDNSRNNYLNTTGVVVSEEDILAYFVWIPRYRYKIWSVDNNNKKGKEQEIEIVFENKNDTKSLGTQIGEYRTHPAFTFGNDELDGIWVGKFETGGTASAPKIKPNIKSLTGQNVSAQFTTSKLFATSVYGSTSNVDSHMMKDSELGAVAYLSHSKYGTNREIYINNSSGFYTGRSGGNIPGSTPINGTYTSQTSTTKYNTYGFYTWDGYLLEYDTNTKSSIHDISKVASTTGNITGIYDMSGGAWEYTMGYYSKASSTWGSTSSANYAGFTNKLDSKYYDEYITTDPLTACDGRICYGHALSETNKWYDDYATFVSASFPWFNRGGYSYSATDGGTFYFYIGSGNGDGFFGFRTVIASVGT